VGASAGTAGMAGLGPTEPRLCRTKDTGTGTGTDTDADTGTDTDADTDADTDIVGQRRGAHRGFSRFEGGPCSSGRSRRSSDRA
jgi:hypothetical protein